MGQFFKLTTPPLEQHRGMKHDIDEVKADDSSS
jgi:hypothetical protein